MKSSFSNKIILILLSICVGVLMYFRLDGMATIANITYEDPNVFTLGLFTIILALLAYLFYDDYKIIYSYIK